MGRAFTGILEGFYVISIVVDVTDA